MDDDLFSTAGDAPAPRTLSDRNRDHRAPLAVRMRPRTLDEVVGQKSVVGEGSPLRRLIAADDARTSPASVILWGPPGTGKTTLAYVVASSGDREFVEVSAVLAGVKDIREVVEAARRRLAATGRETVLFVDEVHRFSKSQQDALLPSVENRWVTLIAATTENPYFSVISPLLSRSIVLDLESLAPEDLSELIDRALTDERGLGGAVELADDAREALLRLGGGDARKILTSLEAAAAAVLMDGGTLIDAEALAHAVNVAALRYDRAGDQHYDVTSAFIKSMRGSDVDAALHYLARMIVAGEDPMFIARRVVIAASEEVAMADPTALPVAMAAMHAVQNLGMPEGRIPLAQAVWCTSPPRRSRTPPTRPWTPRSPTSGRAGAARCRPICATPTTRGRESSGTGRATSTRTTRRTAWRPSSTRRTISWGATTTRRAAMGPRPRCRGASRRCGGSRGARDRLHSAAGVTCGGDG